VVAVLYLEGVIVEGDSMKGYAGSSTIQRQLSELRNRSEVKSIVLRVNSPGGSATASEIIRQSILDFQATDRPVVVSMGGMAASGGYWVSAPAQRIIAQPDTVTGSIGVFGMLLDLEGLSGKIGLTFDTVSTGEHINPYALSRPKTEEELAFVQQMVDNIYEDFLNNVARHRDMEHDAVHAIAQGRVWTGAQARANGLVDELGGLGLAIQTAADLAGLAEFDLEHHPEEKTSLEVLAELLGEDLAKLRVPSKIEAQLHALQREIKGLRAWNDPRNIYARLPFPLY
jgi:protease-4